jgi:hypothetical protein
MCDCVNTLSRISRPGKLGFPKSVTLATQLLELACAPTV